MRLRSALAAVAIVVGAAASVTGLIAWREGSGSPRAEPVVDRGRLPTSPTTPPQDPRPTGTAGRAVPTGSRLHIPALQVNAPIGTVAAVSGVMDVPDDPHRVAWWRDGAAPGGARGSAVIVGHINFHGVSGALASLPRLRPGDTVHLTEPGYRTLHYRVSAVRTYSKSHGLPAALFARNGVAQLALITCGGPFDAATGNYEDNIVAYAVPA